MRLENRALTIFTDDQGLWSLPQPSHCFRFSSFRVSWLESAGGGSGWLKIWKPGVSFIRDRIHINPIERFFHELQR